MRLSSVFWDSLSFVFVFCLEFQTKAITSPWALGTCDIQSKQIIDNDNINCLPSPTNLAIPLTNQCIGLLWLKTDWCCGQHQSGSCLAGILELYLSHVNHPGNGKVKVWFHWSVTLLTSGCLSRINSMQWLTTVQSHTEMCVDGNNEHNWMNTCALHHRCGVNWKETLS